MRHSTPVNIGEFAYRPKERLSAVSRYLKNASWQHDINDINALLYLSRYSKCHHKTSVAPHIETVDLTGEDFGSADPYIVDDGKQLVIKIILTIILKNNNPWTEQLLTLCPFYFWDYDFVEDVDRMAEEDVQISAASYTHHPSIVSQNKLCFGTSFLFQNLFTFTKA